MMSSIPTDFSLSNAVLLAHKFTQRHALFQWRQDENHLQDIGNRVNKYMFVVDLVDLAGSPLQSVLISVLPNQASLLTMTNAYHSNLDSSQQAQGITSNTYKIKALLVSIRHPFILPVLDYYAQKSNKGGMVIAQSFIPNGSLKDLICRKTNPKRRYEEKYGPKFSNEGLPIPQLARFGRQILEVSNIKYIV